MFFRNDPRIYGFLPPERSTRYGRYKAITNESNVSKVGCGLRPACFCENSMPSGDLILVESALKIKRRPGGGAPGTRRLVITSRRGDGRVSANSRIAGLRGPGIAGPRESARVKSRRSVRRCPRRRGAEADAERRRPEADQATALLCGEIAILAGRLSGHSEHRAPPPLTRLGRRLPHPRASQRKRTAAAAGDSGRHP